MYLDTPSRAKFLKQPDYSYPPDGQNLIYCTVLYFIQSSPHLSMVYLNWSSLQVYEKFLLNKQIIQSLPMIGEYIYPPVIQAFEYWDMLQEKFGAPGFGYISFTPDLSEETDRDIVKLLFVMEQTINQIHIKRKLMEDISSCQDMHNILYSYKWRVIAKSFYNKWRNYTNKMARSDDGSCVSDLNGCGDTAWISDIED